MINNKTFIVSGSNGFLGKSLEKFLIKKGANFYGLDLKKSRNTIAMKKPSISTNNLNHSIKFIK